VDGVDEVFAAVAYDGLEADGNSDFVEFLSEIEGVRVLTGRGEHLGADGDDFGFHRETVVSGQWTVISCQRLKEVLAFYS
jgi:hypothetical protein